MSDQFINGYSKKEERLNILTHAFGLFASLMVFFFFILKSVESTNKHSMLSSIIFGCSLCVLYAASTIYHSAVEPNKRKKLKIFDHTSIYVLIAGTYTPFCLVTLNNKIGWIILIAVWLMAFIGIIIKFFFIGKFDLLSTIMYVAMGWIIVFAIKPLIANLPNDGLLWLIGGGIAYTIGAVFYMVKKIKFNHAIFHMFVLLGSFCHVMSIYHYIL